VGYTGAVALSIVPGQEDRVRNFEQELAPHRQEWERLNREAGGWTRFSVHFQETPMGNFMVNSWELEEPEKVRQAFTDSPFDAWWLDFLRDVNGIDLRNLPPEQAPTPPPLVFEWRA
jgi:hypothetical protein